MWWVAVGVGLNILLRPGVANAPGPGSTLIKSPSLPKIPTTRLPGIAANFGEDGVIYILRVPKEIAIPPLGWQGLQQESEFIILNSVPSGSIVKVIPANRVAPILVDEAGLLVPGPGVP